MKVISEVTISTEELSSQVKHFKTEQSEILSGSRLSYKDKLKGILQMSK